MPNGIQLSSGVVVGQPIPLDAKFGPYNSTTDALNDIGVDLRYRGLTVGVFESGLLTEYWFKDGIGNEHFVAKSSDVTWDSLLDKPDAFPPSSHSHTLGEVTDLVSSLNERPVYVQRESVTIPEITNEFDLSTVPLINNATTRYFELVAQGSNASPELTIVVGSNAENTWDYGFTTLERVVLVQGSGGTRRPFRFVRRMFVAPGAFTDNELVSYPATSFPSTTVDTFQNLNNRGTWRLKAPESHTHLSSDITDFSEKVAEASPPATWETLQGKPSSFPPSDHGHPISQVSGLQHELNIRAVTGEYHDLEIYSEDDYVPTIADIPSGNNISPIHVFVANPDSLPEVYGQVLLPMNEGPTPQLAGRMAYVYWSVPPATGSVFVSVPLTQSDKQTQAAGGAGTNYVEMDYAGFPATGDRFPKIWSFMWAGDAWIPQPASVNSKTPAINGVISLAKSDVGLANVDNTSDADKPISTATQIALSNKANASHTHTVSDISNFYTASAPIIYEHFLTLYQGLAGQLQRVTVTPGTVETLAVNGETGVIRCNSGTGVNRPRAAIAINTGAIHLGQGTAYSLEWRIRIPPDGTGAGPYDFSFNSYPGVYGVGFAFNYGVTTFAQRGLFFRWTNFGFHANSAWKLVARNDSGVEDSVTTDVGISTDWTVFRININADGTVATGYINGVAIGTVNPSAIGLTADGAHVGIGAGLRKLDEFEDVPYAALDADYVIFNEV